MATSLISGFIAKEAVISTLGVLVGEAGIASAFTAASAYSFLTFTLLYTPCVAAVTAIKKELKSLPMTIIIVVMQCLIAWIMSCVLYQIIVACGG